jgi:hypothetical protein
MKLLTLFALAVAALAIFGRYSGSHPTGVPRRGAQPEELFPTTVAQPEVVVPQQQHVSQEQANNGNGQPSGLDDVLSASREPVILAIQESVQGTDVNRTLSKANAGDPSAQYDMGLRCADGEGVPQNFADAMAWFVKAASSGNANAQWKLGLGYLNGIGVPHDESQAVTWFKRAANNGDTRAQTALSDLYFRGRGVHTDYVRAYTWASIAARSRGNDSNYRLNAIRSRMTTVQIEDAERRTAIWRDYVRARAAGSADSQRVAVPRRPPGE